MWKLKFLCLSFMILHCLTSPCSAQEKKPCLLPVDSIIKEQQPKWKFVKKRLGRKGSYSYFEWKVGRTSLDVTAWNFNSEEIAEKEFDDMPQLFKDRGFEMEIISDTNQIGNEGYFWMTKQGRYGIDFRIDKAVFHIDAPSKKLALKLTQYVQEFCISK
jgi:hypothetical protein